MNWLLVFQLVFFGRPEGREHETEKMLTFFFLLVFLLLPPLLSMCL